jgi:transketolase
MEGTMVDTGVVTETGVLERERPASERELANRADWIRLQAMKLIEQAGFGHYSSTFSCAEIYSVLYYHTLRLRPSDPTWSERDRFLLGKGHAGVGLWPIFADLGLIPKEWLDTYGKLGSPITDHPNMRTAPVDFSSGSLGHNLSVAVGMSLAARLSGRDYRSFVVTGDGELQEGQVWEAAMAGSHYHLGNLIAIVDANGFSGGGPTSRAMNIEPLGERFTAFGWRVVEINGNEVAELVTTFDALPDPGSEQPTCVIARTHKGAGLKMMEEAPQTWHMGLMTPEQHEAAITEIEARIA